MDQVLLGRPRGGVSVCVSSLSLVTPALTSTTMMPTGNSRRLTITLLRAQELGIAVPTKATSIRVRTYVARVCWHGTSAVT